MLGVAVMERSGWFRNNAEEQSGRVAHDPPGLHSLDALGAQVFKPAHLSVEVVGMDIEMQAAVAIHEPLDEQSEFLAGELDPVILGVVVELSQRLAGSRAPELHLAVAFAGRNVNHNLGQPAVMRHAANIPGWAPRASATNGRLLSSTVIQALSGIQGEWR
jgi:hypothetical protein